jgi:hypothetical protein
VFIRHSNVNESLPFEYAKEYLTTSKKAVTDGGIMDGPNAGTDIDQFYISHHKLMFMEQETKQYTFQFGLDATLELPRVKYGIFSFNVGYVFEYIYNAGVDAQMFSNTMKSGGSEQQLQDEADRQKKAWKNNLRNITNNYVKIGMKIVY